MHLPPGLRFGPRWGSLQRPQTLWLNSGKRKRVGKRREIWLGKGRKGGGGKGGTSRVPPRQIPGYTLMQAIPQTCERWRRPFRPSWQSPSLGCLRRSAWVEPAVLACYCVRMYCRLPWGRQPALQPRPPPACEQICHIGLR